MAEIDEGKLLFEVELGAFGGRFAPTDYEDFVRLVDDEKAAWEWLTSTPPTDPSLVQMQTQFKNQLNSIQAYAAQLAAAGSLSGQDPAQFIRNNWGGPQPQAYHSSSATGQAITAIGKSVGTDEALLALALVTGQTGIDVRNPRHFRALSLVSNPAMIEPAGRVEATDDLLARTQDVTRRLHRRQLQMIRDDAADWANQVTTGRRIVFKLLKRHMSMNRAAATRHDKTMHASVDAIDNTRKAYEAQMQLRAAVGYWTKKEEGHAARVETSYGQLINFIVGAGIASVVVFVVAISFLLELSGVDMPFWAVKPPAGTVTSPATYVIVSVAVATVLTSLFWAARVLLKNYLTERHLERDASERSVMTQTFLALIKEGGVKDEDRLVILNSLFRPSSDLPSVDDGPGDVTLPAIMARLLDARK